MTCKNCSGKFFAMSYTSTSVENDMDHAHMSYKFHIMVLMLARGLTPLLPSNVQRLGIHSCGVLLSCIMCTKQILSFLSPYFGSTEMSYSSDPLSSLLLLDLFVDIGFLLAVRMLPDLSLSLKLLLSQSIVQVW
jgi:hypothetical protein